MYEGEKVRGDTQGFQFVLTDHGVLLWNKSFAQRLSLTDVQAQPVTGPGPGLRVALGGTVNSDMSVAQRDNNDYPQTNISPLFSNQVQFNGTVSYESIGFNPGFRFDFAPGYRLNQWINFEFETGCIYNTVESYTISGNGTFTGVSGNPNLNGTMKLDAEGYLLQVPLMVNVEFSYPIGDGWRPFVGAGGGGMFQKLTVNTISGTINYQGDLISRTSWGLGRLFSGAGTKWLRDLMYQSRIGSMGFSVPISGVTRCRIFSPKRPSLR